jgi:hypothetical protein
MIRYKRTSVIRVRALIRLPTTRRFVWAVPESCWAVSRCKCEFLPPLFRILSSCCPKELLCYCYRYQQRGTDANVSSCRLCSEFFHLVVPKSCSATAIGTNKEVQYLVHCRERGEAGGQELLQHVARLCAVLFGSFHKAARALSRLLLYIVGRRPPHQGIDDDCCRLARSTALGMDDPIGRGSI